MATIASVHTLDDLAAPTPELKLMLETARDMARPAAQTQSTTRLDIRTLPVSTSLLSKAGAAWSSGLAPSETLGPFLDKLGRPAWVDVYPIVRILRFERSPGAAPFLVVPVSVIVRHDALLGPHHPPPVEFNLAAGSVWIQSRQLASGAPADGFTGLRIKGGTIRLSAPPVFGPGGAVVVPPSVTVTLSLTLDPPAGAVWVSVTVHVLTAPCPRLVGVQATPETTNDANRLMVAVFELLPRVAVTVAV